MLTHCPYWDISYLVAVFFAVGSLCFIAGGLFSWLPLEVPSSEFPGEVVVAAGVTSFVGATLFQIGAILLVLEACNENRTGCFGWALYEAFEGDSDSTIKHDAESGHGDGGGFIVKADPTNCSHHHRGRSHRKKSTSRQSKSERKWTWFPSLHELRTHYLHEIGFVASTTLAIGATIFWITGICALPGIYSNMSVAVARGIYWLTYLVGGVLFTISSVLYMLEEQRVWYVPSPHLLGWHVGFWNLVGSVGWVLAASFGYCIRDSGCEYQCELTLIWASAGFFAGSFLQWYEAVSKYSIERSG